MAERWWPPEGREKREKREKKAYPLESGALSFLCFPSCLSIRWWPPGWFAAALGAG
jgi:hypothetical protein